MLVLLVACSPTPTATSTMPDSSNGTIPTPVVQSAVISGNAGLWLQVLSPLDEAVVDVSEVEVTGSAPAGTVISIDDDFLIVGADLQFKTTVPLEEGPNLIEVIASDNLGDEISALLTVTYEP